MGEHSEARLDASREQLLELFEAWHEADMRGEIEEFHPEVTARARAEVSVDWLIEQVAARRL